MYISTYTHVFIITYISHFDNLIFYCDTLGVKFCNALVSPLEGALHTQLTAIKHGQWIVIPAGALYYTRLLMT